MSADTLDIFIEGREDTPVHAVWQDSSGTPIDLTGYSAKMQVRAAVDGNVIVEKSSGAGSIALGGAAGTVDYTFTSAETVTLGTAAPRGAVHDLVLTSGGGVVTKLFKGRITVDPAVTQA